MKGAFVLAEDPNLYEDMRRTLVAFGARTAPDRTTQLTDGDCLFTVFGIVGPESEADLREAPTHIHGDASDFDQLSATACWVECRSEAVFVKWVRIVAEQRANPTWVLDGDGALWAADALDPTRLVL